MQANEKTDKKFQELDIKDTIKFRQLQRSFGQWYDLVHHYWAIGGSLHNYPWASTALRELRHIRAASTTA